MNGFFDLDAQASRAGFGCRIRWWHSICSESHAVERTSRIVTDACCSHSSAQPCQVSSAAAHVYVPRKPQPLTSRLLSSLPTAVSLLYTCTRLFPQDANMLLIRNLLHRLLKQCDVCIAGNNGTEHEVVRAHETKRVVLEFDRFAFAFEEASASASVTADAGAGTGAGRNGDGRDAMDGGAGSGPGPGPVVKGISSSTTTMPASSSSMTNGVKSEEETGLFGEEITASLGAMGLELNLWGGILEGESAVSRLYQGVWH